MNVQQKKSKKYNLRLLLISNTKKKKIFKKLGAFNSKVYSLNMNCVPYILKNGANINNNFFVLLNNFKSEYNKKIKYK